MRRKRPTIVATFRLLRLSPHTAKAPPTCVIWSRTRKKNRVRKGWCTLAMAWRRFSFAGFRAREHEFVILMSRFVIYWFTCAFCYRPLLTLFISVMNDLKNESLGTNRSPTRYMDYKFAQMQFYTKPLVSLQRSYAGMGWWRLMARFFLGESWWGFLLPEISSYK